MIPGHEWLIFVAAILVESVVIVLLWRLTRPFTPLGPPRQTADDAVHDPARKGERL